MLSTRVNVMHVRILFANPSHNANSVTEFDFPWRANANANFVLLILRNDLAGCLCSLLPLLLYMYMIVLRILLYHTARALEKHPLKLNQPRLPDDCVADPTAATNYVAYFFFF